MGVSDVLTLAQSHRDQAERSEDPAERLELHRIADIYLVLATINMPLQDLDLSASPNGASLDHESPLKGRT